MYIVELFVKWLNKNKRGRSANPDKIMEEGQFYNSEGELISEELDDAIDCNHNFMPIDSTGEVLACTKCGFVIKKRIKNPFINKKSN